MDSLLGMLMGQLGGDNLSNISSAIGANKKETEKAVGAAIPLLLEALARNSTDQKGATALAQALENDHDGSVLDNLGGYIPDFLSGSGDGILRHVLGFRRGSVESAVGKLSGMKPMATGKLLTLLAPLVMGALGKAKRSGGLDAGGLASMLEQEKERVEKETPFSLPKIAASLLDQDGDGDISDDLLGIGAKFLGGLLGRRK